MYPVAESMGSLRKVFCPPLFADLLKLGSTPLSAVTGYTHVPAPFFLETFLIPFHITIFSFSCRLGRIIPCSFWLFSLPMYLTPRLSTCWVPDITQVFFKTKAGCPLSPLLRKRGFPEILRVPPTIPCISLCLSPIFRKALLAPRCGLVSPVILRRLTPQSFTSFYTLPLSSSRLEKGPILSMVPDLLVLLYRHRSGYPSFPPLSLPPLLKSTRSAPETRLNRPPVKGGDFLLSIRLFCIHSELFPAGTTPSPVIPPLFVRFRLATSRFLKLFSVVSSVFFFFFFFFFCFVSPTRLPDLL